MSPVGTRPRSHHRRLRRVRHLLLPSAAPGPRPPVPGVGAPPPLPPRGPTCAAGWAAPRSAWPSWSSPWPAPPRRTSPGGRGDGRRAPTIVADVPVGDDGVAAGASTDDRERPTASEAAGDALLNDADTAPPDRRAPDADPETEPVGDPGARPRPSPPVDPVVDLAGAVPAALARHPYGLFPRIADVVDRPQLATLRSSGSWSSRC